jgi:hypothetical protein
MQANAQVGEPSRSLEELHAEADRALAQLAETEREVTTAKSILVCGYHVDVSSSGNANVWRSLEGSW